MKKVTEAIEDMSGIEVNVQVVSQGELLKSTGRWQSGLQTTLLNVRANELVTRTGWQDKLRPDGIRQGLAACQAAIDPALSLDCQPRISLWLR